MIKIHKFTIKILALIFIFTAGCSSALSEQNKIKNDFKLTCDSYSKLLKSSKEDGTDKAILNDKVTKELEEQVSVPQIKQAVTAIYGVDHASKYEMFKLTAEELKYADWTCLPMKKFFE